ncbi:MAG: TonB-dependent receptor [Porphyromonadaceae bacterium]|nr:TonB-dependent receptor [Porphyromonadaceae bacterium]
MKQKICILSLFICLFSGVFSQSKVENVELNELEVSADRTKMYSGLGRIVTVVEKLEIEQAAVRSIDDLLEFVAGIDVRQRGIYGVQSDVSIRGGSFDQILVLLNGINITDPQTGHFNLDIPIDISDVSRIEILQGSAARVLGPNAFSGAINIITNDNGKNRISNQISAGSFGYLSNVTSGNYSTEKYNIFGSVSHRKSDGYIDNTDFKITNAFVQSGIKTANAGNFNLQLSYQQKSFGANSFYSLTYPNQFEHTKTLFSALSWDYTFDKWSFNAQAYWRQHHDRFELFRNYEGAESFPWYTDHNYHQTDVTGSKIVVSNLWKMGKTSIGADIRNEHIFSTVLGENIEKTKAIPFHANKLFTKETNRFISTAFADHSLNLNNWYFSLGAAATHSTKFGTHFNGGADIAYRFSDVARIYTAANSAVRLPTFTDLYYQSATHISNLNLQPEKSMTFEIGSKINPIYWTFTAVGYYRLGNNIIDWVRPEGAEKSESRNLTKVNALGFDVSYEYRFADIFIKSIGTSYSFLHLDKDAAGLDSKYALDYLKHKFTLNVKHSVWSKLSANWQLGAFDRSGNFTDFVSGALTDYDPYWMLNSKLIWKEENLMLFGEINNILNQEYVEFGGIRQPGVNFNLGIKLSI